MRYLRNNRLNQRFLVDEKGLPNKKSYVIMLPQLNGNSFKICDIALNGVASR